MLDLAGVGIEADDLSPAHIPAHPDGAPTDGHALGQARPAADVVVEAEAIDLLPRSMSIFTRSCPSRPRGVFPCTAKGVRVSESADTSRAAPAGSLPSGCAGLRIDLDVGVGETSCSPRSARRRRSDRRPPPAATGGSTRSSSRSGGRSAPCRGGRAGGVASASDDARNEDGPSSTARVSAPTMSARRLGTDRRGTA